MLPTKFRFICLNGFRGEESKKSANQKQESPMAAMLVPNRDRMSNLYRGPSIDASTKFRIIWPSGFRRKDFQKSTNQKQKLPVTAMFVNGSGLNEQSLQRTFHRCFLPSFGSFGKAVSQEKIFQKSTNQKQEFSMVAMFVNGSRRNEQS